MNESYHIPVLLNESLDGLSINPEGVYVDATFGGGGHSREIIKRLTSGRLIAFDQDDDAALNVIDDERFLFINHNFKYFKNFLKYFEVNEVDGVLADLGVSSHHFDEAGRGFSFRFDAALDMRMNQRAKLTAEKVINTYKPEDLRRIFKLYGEVQHTGKLVSIIEKSRQEKEIKTIGQFLDAIKNCVPKNRENQFLAKVFQALRIEVNKEIEVLEEFLLQAMEFLKPGGRLVVISYHSLEDRLVKNFFRTGNIKGEVKKDFYGNLETPFKIINRKVIIPKPEELEENNRSRSAKLRIAEKL